MNRALYDKIKIMIQTHNIEEFKNIAKSFVVSLKPQETASVVGLSGNLGSGKTTFTQEIARTLGVTETVTSPTFVIEKIYKLPEESGFKHLIHIDAYRLEKEIELLHLGWEEIVRDPYNLILIEWPEKVSGIMPKNAMYITFTFIDENTREIHIKNER